MRLETVSENSGPRGKVTFPQQVAIQYPRCRLCLLIDGLTIITDDKFAQRSEGVLLWERTSTTGRVLGKYSAEIDFALFAPQL